MVDPRTVCLFVPPGLKKFKLALFEGIGAKIKRAGGSVISGDYEAVRRLPDDVIPIVGVSPEFRTQFADWKARGRSFIYWDRGYLRRVFATWLPNGNDLGVPGGYYRWHLNGFQMSSIRDDVSADRWAALRLESSVRPWNRNGRHVVVADTGHDYWDVFADRDWVSKTVSYLKTVTDRPIVVRDKEQSVNAAMGQPVDLVDALRDAHCLVTHGSIAAVEAAIMGCPVFVDQISAAAVIGDTDFSRIETPVYPDRTKWLWSLASHQWNERELVDGTLWRQLT